MAETTNVADGLESALGPDATETSANPLAPPLEPEDPETEQPKSTTKRSTRKTKSSEKKGSPAPSSQLRSMLPSQERVLVYKRRENGNMAFVNDYSADELKAHPSIEVFLKQYVVPQYGYGDFFLQHQYQGRKPSDIGTTRIEEPQKTEHSNGVQAIRELFQTQQQMASQANGSNSHTLEQMNHMLKLAKEMGIVNVPGSESGEEKKQDPIERMMQMQIMEKMMGPKDNGQQVLQQIQPIFDKLVDRIEKIEQGQKQKNLNEVLGPPQPPPQPNSDPAESLKPVLESFTQTMSSMMQSMMQMMMQNQQQAQQKAQQQESSRLDELRYMKEIMQPQQSPLEQTLSLLPTLKEIFQPSQEADELDVTLHRMKQIEEIKKLSSEDESSVWKQIGSGIASLLNQDNLGQKVQGMAGLGQEQPQPETKQVTSESSAEQEKEPELVIPEGTRQVAQQIEQAEEAGGRVGASVMVLQHVGKQSSQFRPFVAKMFALARDNEKQECLKYLREFFEGLADSEVLDPEKAQQVLSDFDEHWDEIRSRMFPSIVAQEKQKADEAKASDENHTPETEDDDSGDEVDPSEVPDENPLDNGAGHTKPAPEAASS